MLALFPTDPSVLVTVILKFAFSRSFIAAAWSTVHVVFSLSSATTRLQGSADEGAGDCALALTFLYLPF